MGQISVGGMMGYSQSVWVHFLHVHRLCQHPGLLYEVDEVVVASLQVPGPVHHAEDGLGLQCSRLQKNKID